MKRIRGVSLSLLTLTLVGTIACAGQPSPPSHSLGEHPAVLVAREGVPADPTARFYLHPARLSWTLSRPLDEGEHPAVLMAHHASAPTIDPNRFIVGHPAGGGPAAPVR